MLFRLILFALLIATLIRWVLKRFGNNGAWTDYSFGLKESAHILNLLKKNAFEAAEKGILALEPDKLSHCVVHITLSLPEEKLEEWAQNSSYGDIPYLFLGAYHHHYAWISRGHEEGNKVSKKQYKGFLVHQAAAYDYLQEVSDTFPNILAEAYVHLISVARGDGNYDEANAYFEMVKEINPDHVMAYVQHAETIQPKWGGNIGLTSSLVPKLPDNQLIQQIIEVKLLEDGIPWNMNYFGGTLVDAKNRSKETLYRIDREVNINPPESIHKYMLFGYLMFLARTVGDKRLEKKYMNKLERNLPLYPFGLPGAGG